MHFGYDALTWISETQSPDVQKNSCMPVPDGAAHSPGQENPLPSTTKILFNMLPVSSSASSRSSYILPSYPTASGYRWIYNFRMSSQTILSVLPLDKCGIGRLYDSFSCFSPCVLMYSLITSIGAPPAVIRQKLWLQKVSFHSFLRIAGNSFFRSLLLALL